MMRLLAIFIPFLVFGASFLLHPESVYGAVNISGGNLNITPQAPNAHSPVTISIPDASTRPGGSSVRWFVDGVEMTNNQDDSSLTIQTKAVGQETVVEARLSSISSNETVVARITPVRLDIIIGSNSTAPSFYQGRALPGSGSTISAQAFVFGDESGPYSYRWTVNGREVLDEVGGASNQIIFTPNLDHEMNVYVEVTNRSGQVVVQGSTVVPLVDSEIHFYEANPLQGLIPNILTSPYYFLNDEITLRAEPYYFSGNVTDFDVVWEVDGQVIRAEEDPLELSLVKTRDEGRAEVDVSITNTSNFSERARGNLLINY